MVLNHHHKGISLRLSATTKRVNQKPTSIGKKKVYLSRPEPKEWINSVKANNIKVDSTVPGIKYYGDNTYKEYQTVNPHQQPQYENTYISPGMYQHE